MSYQNINALITKQISNFSLVEQGARLAAQNFVNALESRLFPQGSHLQTPRALFVMDRNGESWADVPSTKNLMFLEGRVLTFAVGVCFFQVTREVAKIILPVALTAHGGDADFVLGASSQVTSSSNGGDYAQVALTAENLIGQAAASWNYDRRGNERITVQ